MKSLALAIMILSTTLTSVCAAEKLSGEKLNWVMTSVHDETVEVRDVISYRYRPSCGGSQNKRGERR